MLNQEKSLIRRILPHIGAIILFIAITMIYFAPLYQGKVLNQGDRTLFLGSSEELREYYDDEGESSAWTGTVFSGMPAYQIGIWGGAPNVLSYIEKPVRELTHGTAGPVLMALIVTYILFCLGGFKPGVSIAGAIAYAFSSYNFIILVAGHMTKAWTIAYIPLIVAGLLVLYQRKYLLSGILMALGLGLQLRNNHVQMTYYTAIMCAVIYIFVLIDFIQAKEFKGLLKGTGLLVAAVILALAANYSNVYNNYLMSEESIRGESELTANVGEDEKKAAGADWDYVFRWSYGKAETFSLLVPDVHGGISKQYGENSAPYKALIQGVQSGQIPQQNAQQLYRYTTEYWGAQPFTSGPVYLGAIICFLFLLGMIIIPHKLKWGMLIVTVLFILLAWGKNFQAFNDLFYYYFPLYAKFRAVSSALVIPAFTIVFVAIWGLKEFLYGDMEKKKRQKALYISLGVTGGICFLLWIAPGAFFNFISPVDEQTGLTQTGGFWQAVLATRKGMLSSDALRSLMFILFATVVLWLSTRPMKMDKTRMALIVSLIIAALVLVDLWGVDRRYIDEDNYMPEDYYEKVIFKQSEADRYILQDNDLSYRVLKLGDPFNENYTSYWHKSIGGHSAVKLRRYQEMIDYYMGAEVQYITGVCSQQFSKVAAEMQNNEQATMNDLLMGMNQGVYPAFANTPMLNMLNARYIIYAAEYPPVVNPHGMGNAWFVPAYKLVENADEEIKALGDIHPADYAIVDKRFAGQLDGLNIVPDSTATIEMTVYKPDRITYKSKAATEQLAVFSEIYFAEGWEARIDGELTDYMRADWTLRALRVPAGEHEITFEFIPHAYNTSRVITTICSSLMILLVLAGLGVLILRKKE
ncbi:YfhO family protein [Dysgonomonas sp. 25]|uniref:YfhO family protein n=1 Tax=Dysgonomonas sp. 25 TaxID=2302933 RepID=UPI0013D62979|nr:YfhO family protein [Dysgonomonas sp. 25]NDV69675.1 hypothetical protein [Dysgonomonas sp. 25]